LIEPQRGDTGLAGTSRQADLVKLAAGLSGPLVGRTVNHSVDAGRSGKPSLAPFAERFGNPLGVVLSIAQ
jgi:hypothetical protein